MGKHHIYALICFLVQFCYGAVQIHDASENMKIHKCVAMITQRIDFVNSTDVTLINVNASLVKELTSLLEHPMRFISRSFYWPNDTLYNDVYVIQCYDYLNFAHGLDLVKRDPFWNPRAKFVIIIEYMEDFLRDISDLLICSHIFDVALVAYGKKEDIVVYTFGLERDECDRPVFKILQLLSRCSKLHDIIKVYVGARKTNLRGCKVKFVSHNYWPFVSFGGRYAIENFLLTLIRKYEGITVDLINYGKIENFGLRLDNFTYTGMLHEIEIYNVEGAVGGYMLNFNLVSNLDFIYPYMVDHYKIVIARAKRLGKWTGVLKQLGVITVWFIFGTFCIACVTVISMEIFKKGQRDTLRDILIVWGYFMGNISQNQQSKSGMPYRIMLLNILQYVFIITITVQASLLSVNVHPIRGDQPSTMEEVLSNYQLIVGSNQYAYLQNNTMVDLTKAKTICKTTLNCMMQVMTNADERLFTVGSDIYHKFYLWEFADENGEPKIYKMRESVGTLLHTMYIRRGSSLVEPFNRMLLRVRSFGLIGQFAESLYLDERLKYKFQSRRIRKPQTLNETKGVFMVLICGYSVSAASFILEYLYYSCKP